MIPMQRKGWLVPILVFFISIICLLFYQRNNVTDSLATTTNLPPILWSKSIADITQLAYSEFGSTLEAIKTEEGWSLTTPITTSADSLYIYNILAYFCEPKFTEVIDFTDHHLLDYGIDSSSPTLTLYDGDNTYRLIRGYSLDEEHYYVYSPDSNMVYSMEKSSFDSLQISLNTWRNKQLLSFKKQEIQEVVVEFNESTYVIKPHFENGVLTFKSDTLSNSLVSSFINFLEGTTIKDFITDAITPTLAENYGITRSTTTITITLVNGKQTTLTFGNILEDEHICYVHVHNSSSIVSIPYFNLEDFVKKTP